MTTKKELSKRLDNQFFEMTKLDQALADLEKSITRRSAEQQSWFTAADLKFSDIEKVIQQHSQHIAEWRILFEQIKTAVSHIRQVAEASITRETARQNKINDVAAEVTKQLENIAKTFAQQSAADGREFKTINSRLDNLEKKTAHDNQQPKQRRPPTKTTAPPTTTAPEKAKLPTSPRTERPAARNRHRPPARTNPS